MKLQSRISEELRLHPLKFLNARAADFSGIFFHLRRSSLSAAPSKMKEKTQKDAGQKLISLQILSFLTVCALHYWGYNQQCIKNINIPGKERN